ncbi:MAG: ferredoxin:glutaredoxin reductase [Candidatus Bathyarchaeota archaeon]|nr:MAG: ferredoxin:glutaredoxin reductase [Candidatus Bathyarchaeota archaeon]
MITLEKVRQRAESDAKSHGYYLNPDSKFLESLLEGLEQNEGRYGYPLCPCRLASGKFELDRDIICPCDYRDPDVEEYGYCYCALYVRKDVFEGKTPIQPIPERRPLEKQARAYAVSTETLAEKPSETGAMIAEKPSKYQRKMWYCKQCGYICFREEPPFICPICRAKREMFGEIRMQSDIHR